MHLEDAVVPFNKLRPKSELPLNASRQTGGCIQETSFHAIDNTYLYLRLILFHQLPPVLCPPALPKSLSTKRFKVKESRAPSSL